MKRALKGTLGSVRPYITFWRPYFSYMIVRLGVGLIFAASIAVYVLTQVVSKSSENHMPSSADDEELPFSSYADEHGGGLKDVIANEEGEEDEEQVVKHMSTVISSPSLSEQPYSEEGDNHIAEEFNTEKERIYEVDMENSRNELGHLRSLVRELEERKVMLEAELLETYALKEQESSFFELKKQLMVKTVEIDMLKGTVNSLESDRKKLQEEVYLGDLTKKELESARKKIKELQRQIQVESMQTRHQLLLLKQQVIGLQVKEEVAVRKDADVEKAVKELEVEVMELKRKNKELQQEKRELMVKLDTAQANVNALSNMSEEGSVAKMREEANALRQANEELTKQVEGLQTNRFSDVEELVYLRWVNACLRFELRNHRTSPGKISAAHDLSMSLSPRSRERAKQLMLEYSVSENGGIPGDADSGSNFDITSMDGGDDFHHTSINSKKLSKLSSKKRPGFFRRLKKWGRSKDDSSVALSSSPASSSFNASPRSVSMRIQRPLTLRNEGDDSPITSFGSAENDSNDISSSRLFPSEDRSNSVSASFHAMSRSVEGILEDKYPAYKDREKHIKENPIIVLRESYENSNESRQLRTPKPSLQPDVEAQGDFVHSLANEVREASFANADDMVQFVKWLDEEMSFLADERALLKRFEWPEAKADALREASFEYRELSELEKKVSSFHDDRNLNCEAALDVMHKLLEKVEQSVYALLRRRDVLVSRYREFGIPVDWLRDSGLVGKMKLGSVRLARDYMNRVLFELDSMREQVKEPNKEFLILQGVRFAFRVYQFAGGFDAESMKAFEDLRSRATSATQNISRRE